MTKSASPRKHHKCSAEQGYRCCVCGVQFIMEFDFQGKNSKIWFKNPAIVAIDKNLPKNWENSVAICNKCASYTGNYDLLDFYHYFIEHGYPSKKKKEYIHVASDIFDEIKNRLENKLKENGCFNERAFNRMLKNPMTHRDVILTEEEIEEEVERRFATIKKNNIQIIDNCLLTTPRSSKNCNFKHLLYDGQLRDKSKARIMMSGEQNHKCCYCGDEMILVHCDNDRFATFEHVISLIDGGQHIYENVVMACRLCNNERGKMFLSAMDYFEYVQKHGSAHSRQHSFDERRHYKMLRYLEWKKSQSAKTLS